MMTLLTVLAFVATLSLSVFRRPSEVLFRVWGVYIRGAQRAYTNHIGGIRHEQSRIDDSIRKSVPTLH